MTFLKKFTAMFLVLILLVPLGERPQAAENDTDELIRQLINYFHHYQTDAQLDMDLILEKIAEQDPELSKTWAWIMEFWADLNGDMEFYPDVLPDGLPEDDSLCIVVMGYYLKDDGSMRDELYQRLHVALASAEKYPNAYIMCTGGGSGKTTEAGQMAKWLKKKGIDPDRIIEEKQARSTIQNATYGCTLLYRDYPQVKNIAVITSDYHIYRSCFYFNTQAALDAYELGVEPMKVVANATCRVDPKASKDLSRQVEGIGLLTDLDVVDMPKPALTKLERISVAGQSEYALGGQLLLAVTAHHSNGRTKDVTAESQISGFDPTKDGFQTINVNYNGQLQSFDVYVFPPETIPTEPPTELPSEPEIESTPEPNPPISMQTLLLIGGGCIVLLILLLLLKAKQAKKRRRRPKPVIKLD